MILYKAQRGGREASFTLDGRFGRFLYPCGGGKMPPPPVLLSNLRKSAFFAVGDAGSCGDMKMEGTLGAMHTTTFSLPVSPILV